MKHLVISFITQDQPGVVEKISSIVLEHQGNWQSSSLHQLSGFFAGIIEVAIKEANVEALTEALQAYLGDKVQIEITNASSQQPEQLFVFELTANDRAGIVQEISSVVTANKGNLEKLVSIQESAPHTGLPLFRAKATIAINKADEQELVNALESLADDIVIDIH